MGMSRRQRRLSFIAAVVLVYVLVMTFGGCADKLILFPTTHRVDAQGASRRTIAWDGKVVEVWAARSPGARRDEPRAFLLEFTGNATRAEHIATYVADRWGERPVEAWVVNYPGYGGSSGPASLRLIGPAALAAHDALRARAGDRPIFLAGNSLGAAAALHVAANRSGDVAGLILQNPPPMRQLILRRFGWWNLWLAAGPVALGVPRELEALQTAPRVKAPAVFLLADNDEIVPPPYQRIVVDAYAGEKKLIHLRGADHNSPVEQTALRELDAAMDWLWAQQR